MTSKRVGEIGKALTTRRALYKPQLLEALCPPDRDQARLGGILMHDLDIFHEHLTMSDEDRAEIAQLIWNQDNVELSTIGIDIGSSTSHLLFAKVLLQRQTQGLSSRFVVVHRQVIWRSPIMLTPFLPDGTIDAARLGAFVAGCYREAGFARDDI